MSTIYDVAREAGVSIATVSRVLQGSPKVLPSTLEKVNAAIRRLNYSPNRLAQQFRVQETRNILVIVPEIGNTFFTDILSGVESVAAANDYNVLMVNSHDDPRVELRYFEMLRQKQVDGIITFSGSLTLDEMKQYAAQYPIVIACRYFDGASLPNVTIDNTKASRDMVNYLLNLGHRDICYLAGPSGIRVYRDRLNGYLSAMDARGIAVNQRLIVNCDITSKGGYNAVNALINAQLPFTAVVASGDMMAVGAIRALNGYGRSVPGDVAVVGFDDIELSALFSPALTTVRQPKRQLGTRAAEKLLDLIAGRPPVAYSEVLDYELIIRESSGSNIALKAT